MTMLEEEKEKADDKRCRKRRKGSMMKDRVQSKKTNKTINENEFNGIGLTEELENSTLTHISINDSRTASQPSANILCYKIWHQEY